MLKMSDVLERIKADGAPLIEDDQVTFLWQGTKPVRLIGDFTDWTRGEIPELQPAGPALWTHTLTLPRDAYVEYSFMDEKGHRLVDGLNRRFTENGMGYANNWLRMPDALDTPLSKTQRGVARGKVTRHTVQSQGFVVGKSRTLHLYQPPVAEPVPLLVVFDGSGYLKRAKLATIVDNLIAEGRIRPVALAMLDPGGQGRTVEYACSDTTVAFITQCVLPTARSHLNLVDVAHQPGAFGMMGASMGGLMSLYTALRVPEIFGSVLCESGAFGADHEPYYLYYRSVIEDLLRLGPTVPLKIWQDVGRYEWFLEPNRQMNALLKERGYNVEYFEHNSGHNYPSWRNVLWRGLEWLYGEAN